MNLHSDDDDSFFKSIELEETAFYSKKSAENLSARKTFEHDKQINIAQDVNNNNFVIF